MGGVPYLVLEPVLQKCTPSQLMRLEEFNPVSRVYVCVFGGGGGGVFVVQSHDYHMIFPALS